MPYMYAIYICPICMPSYYSHQHFHSTRYQYYQSAQSLNISVLAKNLAAEDLDVVIGKDSLKVTVKVE